MKLSIHDKDFPSEKHFNARVFAGGTELNNVIEADEEAGYAICYASDPSGKPIPLPDGEYLATITYRGRVEIKEGKS